MIKYQYKPTKEQKKVIDLILNEIIDLYGDVYITRNNLRLAIIENRHLFYDCLNKGDQIAFELDEGLIFITGFSDNANRYYLKFLVKNNIVADKLLKLTLWNVGDKTLWVKIKKENPIKNILQKNGFLIFGYRGKEILFKREGKVKLQLINKGDHNA